MTQHTGRRYLVTGATSGIGRATAELLAEQGAALTLVARNAEGLAHLASALPGAHETLTADLTRVDDIPALVTQLGRSQGGLHGVVHCAGIHRVTPLKILSATTMTDLHLLNVIAGAMLVKGLRVRGAHAPQAAVVLLSSAVGLVGQPGVSAYAASKGAVVSLTKSLALELTAEDIRVNCVCPGVVRTPMTQGLADSIGTEGFAAVEAMHPLGFGEARDVAHPISFLLSPEARWITGAALSVDGGYTAQ